MGLPIPGFSHGLIFLVTSPNSGATQSPLIKTKDTPVPAPPITQAITWDLGALCQEPGQRLRIYLCHNFLISISVSAVFSSLSLGLLPERSATLMVYEDVVQIVSGFQGMLVI